MTDNIIVPSTRSILAVEKFFKFSTDKLAGSSNFFEEKKDEKEKLEKEKVKKEKIIEFNIPTNNGWQTIDINWKSSY
jgi:hypothetical protein